jgi:hypothetical protein
VDTDADPHADSVEFLEVPRSFLDLFQHCQCGANCAKRSIRCVVVAEQRHEPIAHVIVYVTAVTFDDVAGEMEITVQKVYDVVRGHPLGKCRETADVCKQDR